MLTNFGAGPGMQTKVETDDVSIWFGHENLVRRAPTTIIKSTSVDAISSPTTTLRQGLVMAFSSDGLWCPCDPAGGDGTSIPRGVLMEATSMLNSTTGAAENKHAMGIMIGGPVKAAALKVGPPPYYVPRIVRDQLRLQGFIFDDEVVPGTTLLAPSAPHFTAVVRKAANYTVTASDSGALFLATAAVTFTLPTIAAGLCYDFVQSADANLVIAGSSNILTFNNASASQVACSTSGQKIGARLRVYAVNITSGSLKWMVESYGGTTLTIS